MKTNIHLSYLTDFLEREMFQTNVLEKITTHLIVNNFFLTRAFYEIMWEI